MIAFCLPGSNFTEGFLKSWTQLLQYLTQNNVEYFVSFASATNIYNVRNACLMGTDLKGKHQKVLNGKDYDQIMWIDSDMVFTPDDFQKLYDANEDIISGVAVSKKNEYNLGNFDRSVKYPRFVPWVPSKQIVEVDACGMFFMLIKKGVYEKMEYPWHEPLFYHEGDIRYFLGEDISFCIKATRLGYRIKIDPSVKIGHEKRVILNAY